jgi:hypothetical protein
MNKQIEDRLDGINDLVDISVRDNTLLENGTKFLGHCKGCFGNGALSFLLVLMEKCEPKQEKDVLWLIQEFMPIMPFYFMEMIFDARLRMQLRFMNVDALKYSVETVGKRWKKSGYIRKGFIPNSLFGESQQNCSE